MIKIITGTRPLLTTVALLSLFLTLASCSGPSPRNSFTNPIISLDYSDPDVCRVGDTYYMTASSFCCVPGLPLLRSTDLVHWELFNYALESVPPVGYYSVPRHGQGVWAPCIRFHGGEFFILWGDPDFGIWQVRTKDPCGKWNEPELLVEGKGMIDPSPLWDDDGKLYIVHAWAKSRCGFNGVLNVIDMQTGEDRQVYDGNAAGNITIEGPKFYKREGTYWILAPAGGVKPGWQVALRSKDIWGPYEGKVVMAQGETDINGPHQGGWVDTKSGEEWFIHFQDCYEYGRLVHLNRVKWKEGWPVMGLDKDGDLCGEPQRTERAPRRLNASADSHTAEAMSDNYQGGRNLHWQWNANDDGSFGSAGESHYTLNGLPGTDRLWDTPNLMLQKFAAKEFTAVAKVRAEADSVGQRAGLTVFGLDYYGLEIVRTESGYSLGLVSCRDADKGSAEEHTTLEENIPQELWLKAEVTDGAALAFSYSTDGESFKEVPATLKAREGKWIGAKIGFFATNPHSSRPNRLQIESFVLNL